jgi:hypothetical protein
MPKLAAARAKKAAASALEAPAGEFPVLEEGYYRIRLAAVEVEKVKNSKDPKVVGAPQWVWKFDVSPEDTSEKSGKFWHRCTLPPEGAEHYDFLNGLFVAPFDAFGVPVDTDTDELVGRDIMAYVIQRVMDKGKRAGKTANEIESLLPLDGALAGVGAKNGSSPDEDFDF